MARPRQKDTFSLFSEVFTVTSILTNEQFGELVRAAYAYWQDGTEFVSEDPAMVIAFGFVASGLERRRQASEANADNANARWHQNDAQTAENSRETAVPENNETQMDAELCETESPMDSETREVCETEFPMDSETREVCETEFPMDSETREVCETEFCMNSGMRNDAKPCETEFCIQTEMRNDAPILSVPILSNPIQSNPNQDKYRAASAPLYANKRFIKPTVSQIEDYCAQQGLHVDAQQFADYYESVGWVVGKGKPMKNWQAAARSWSRSQAPPEKQEVYTPPEPEDIDPNMISYWKEICHD